MGGGQGGGEGVACGLFLPVFVLVEDRRSLPPGHEPRPPRGIRGRAWSGGTGRAGGKRGGGRGVDGAGELPVEEGGAGGACHGLKGGGGGEGDS